MNGGAQEVNARTRYSREHRALIACGALEPPRHGYAGYCDGCRCEQCRDAKREYMRQRRARSHLAGADEGAPFTHGTRSGYEERGCRCAECTEAYRAPRRAWARRRRAEAAA